ncbi:MAG: hypothetical protein ABJE66_28270 [Deltaproteobacteria bacterium]
MKYGFAGITPCGGDLVCNANGTCVVPQCKTTPDCNDPTLTCDIYGECIPAGNGSGSGSASQYTLTVEIVGSGAGAVTSTPPGISCSSGICNGTFDAGTQVQLAQTATAGAFLGWTSACQGTDTCTVALSSDEKVGAMFGTKGEPLWSKALDGSSLEWGHGVVANDDGDVIAVGQYIGTLALDTVTIQSDASDVTSAYVVKLDGLTGKAIWGKNFPVESADMIASDGEAFFILGRFSGTVQLGATTLTSVGSYDLYVMKLNSTGSVQWAISVGGQGQETSKGIAVANGTVAFVGWEPNGITIGSTTTPDSGSTTGFVVALDAASGSIKWSHVFAASGGGALSTSVYAGTSMSVAGAVAGTVDFGSGGSAPIGTTDAFVAPYDFTTGTLGTLQRWGGSGSSASISAVSQDTAGHLVIAGEFSGTLTLGSQTYTATGAAGFVANLNGATNVWYAQWSTTPSGSPSVLFAPSSISLGSSDIAIAGNFCNGMLRVNTTNLMSTSCTVQNPLRTGFLVRMKNNGSTYVAIHSLGPYGWADSVSRAADNRLFTTGKFNAALSLDQSPPVLLQASDGGAAYVVAFAP